MQFTMVSDVPRASAGALWATSVEKRGESATTVIPQKNKNPINATTELLNNNKGETRQQVQERNNEMVAIFFAPKRWEIDPLIIQAIPPDAIIRKEKSATFKFIP